MWVVATLLELTSELLGWSEFILLLGVGLLGSKWLSYSYPWLCLHRTGWIKKWEICCFLILISQLNVNKKMEEKNGDKCISLIRGFICIKLFESQFPSGFGPPPPPPLLAFLIIRSKVITKRLPVYWTKTYWNINFIAQSRFIWSGE